MTHIKICGITSLADAIASVEAGADMLGFNFYPPSPRSISPEECSIITSVLVKEFPEVSLVGVFVNMPVEQVMFIIKKCSLKYAQLHGDETAEMLASMPGTAYKAFRGLPDLELFEKYISTTPAILLDAFARGLYGGSGTVADWPLAANLAKHYPLLLAGGLHAGNVAEAVSIAKPWGVDSASGVESSPGRKDADKIKAFIEAVKSASI